MIAAKDPRFADAIKAMKSLERAGYVTRLAGGCVRDRLLGKKPADYDLATTATPAQMLQHFRAEKLSTIPTGIEHGTVTVLMPSGPVEITTLRRDEKTDGRHAEVAFGKSFREDAQRRDFTINALFEDADGTIDDFVAGQADLKAGCLRFVGPPAARMREDYLRILRLFRFWACLGFPPDAQALAAVKAECSGLKQISQERVTQEWMKLAMGPAAPAALKSMSETGVLAIILPELVGEARPLPEVAALAAWQTGAPAFLSLLAGLGLRLGMDETQLTQLAERLRLSSRDSKRLAFFAAARGRLLALGEEIADSLTFLADCAAVGGEGSYASLYAPVLQTDAALAVALQRLDRSQAAYAVRLGPLPLDGKDVVRYTGIPPGPEVGRILTTLRRAYYNGEWASQDDGIRYLKSLQRLEAGPSGDHD